MLKKTINYIDYEGNKRTEDFFFNLSKAEVVKMNMSYPGGLEKKFKKVVESQDGNEIMKIFEDIIVKSYGEKSEDGKRFMKSAALSESFMQTEAYSELFMELVTNPDNAAAFCRGIIPADLGNADEMNNKQKTLDFVANK